MNKNKILNGFIFVAAGLMVGSTFVTATTYSQLIIGILLYLLLAPFFFWVFPRGARVVYPEERTTVVWPPVGAAVETGAAIKKTAGVIDIDKRAFLKLLGGAGIALFLFSVFRNKIDSLFFKGLPSPQNTSPSAIVTNTDALAQDQPMDGYSISEIDDNIIAFYGFTNEDGSWYIMREDSDVGSFRYTKGNSDFPGSWTARANLKYDYYSNVFKN